jgi:malate dehydrogenase (oxaloacetate-decarboxylating)(NADP+)
MMFLGLSAGNVLSAEMLLTMVIILCCFAMANPVPEIDCHHLAIATVPDIMAMEDQKTPNQKMYFFRKCIDVFVLQKK